MTTPDEPLQPQPGAPVPEVPAAAVPEVPVADVPSVPGTEPVAPSQPTDPAAAPATIGSSVEVAGSYPAATIVPGVSDPAVPSTGESSRAARRRAAEEAAEAASQDSRRRLLIVSGVVLAVLVNASAIDVAADLWKNAATRAAVVAAAESTTSDREPGSSSGRPSRRYSS